MILGTAVTTNESGVLMVVEQVHGDYALCVWFDAEANFHRDHFLIAELVAWERV